ncbi:13276_t:CDS:2 [Funneliformis mosseae]|uniref:13276_t:CDS:1 n=1 Tax=Funneliformis mosseae TaxID=27381 RepID=A0A9N9BAI3_FUNMO|nr:13276_t:CDS:2 [Funneliformis mosseae]
MLGSKFITLLAVMLALVCLIVSAAPAPHAKPPNPKDLQKEEVLVADVFAVKSDNTNEELKPYNINTEDVDNEEVKKIIENAKMEKAM